MGCKNGHPDCLDTTDRPHGCPTLVPPRTDDEVLAAAVKWITEGAEDGLGTTLSGRMCEVLTEHLHALSVARGRAVLYEVAKHNPTLSQRVARERAAGRGGPGSAA